MKIRKEDKNNLTNSLSLQMTHIHFDWTDIISICKNELS